MTNKIGSFDLSNLETADEAIMTVSANGRLTNMVMVFAGPGHPATIEQGNRLTRERLHNERLQYEARVNNRKWKAPDETPEQVIDSNVRMVVERLLDWFLVDDSGWRIEDQVKMNGEPFPFSQANAKALFSDRRKTGLLLQALEFLNDESAFIKRSATN